MIITEKIAAAAKQVADTAEALSRAQSALSRAEHEVARIQSGAWSHTALHQAQARILKGGSADLPTVDDTQAALAGAEVDLAEAERAHAEAKAAHEAAMAELPRVRTYHPNDIALLNEAARAQ
jgi:uncharacterized protein (DUF3084 family)